MSDWIREQRYRWFNIHPSPSMFPLINRSGKKYWIDVMGDRPFKISITRFGKSCGFISLVWESDYLEVGDLYICKNHRGQGLGAAVLLWLIDYARQQQVHTIKAIVSPVDPQDFEKTMDWYLRCGFVRLSPKSAAITMILR